MLDTRQSLLVRLQDKRDLDAWDKFVEIYRPVLHADRLVGLSDGNVRVLTDQTSGPNMGWMITRSGGEVGFVPE